MDLFESLWFMTVAFERHYTRKYPNRKAMIQEMAAMLRAVLGANPSEGGGGVGMLRGWVEEFEENEAKRQARKED